MMGSDTRCLGDGFPEETRIVSTLTSRVAETREGWDRSATSGAVAQKDTSELRDAQGGEVPQ